jgi:hypothetical protein
MYDIIPNGEKVFARWKDGYFYPGIVSTISDDKYLISYLNGSKDYVPKNQIVGIEESLITMQLQGNWEYGGWFYKGVISNSDPLTMHYNDGDIEKIDWRQIRGAKVGDSPFIYRTVRRLVTSVTVFMTIREVFSKLKGNQVDSIEQNEYEVIDIVEEKR